MKWEIKSGTGSGKVLELGFKLRTPVGQSCFTLYVVNTTIYPQRLQNGSRGKL